MFTLTFTVILLIVSEMQLMLVADPCTSYISIDQEERSINYITEPGGTIICDITLASEWYRFVSGAGGQLTTRDDLPLYSCGTEVPIYMVDDHPTNDTILNTVARGNYYALTYEYDIMVKKCDEFFVYFLPPTECTQAYCAGTGVRCPERTNSPTGFAPGCITGFPYILESPTIDARLLFRQYPGIPSINGFETPVFDCKFAIEPPDDGYTVGFNVTWYVDGEVVDVVTVRTSIIEGTYEYVSTLSEFSHPVIAYQGWYSLGQNIQCMVASFYDETDITGPPFHSEEFYAGIQTSPRSVVIKENGDPVHIDIMSTIPVSCNGGDTSKTCILIGVLPDPNKASIPEGCAVDMNDYIVGDTRQLKVSAKPGMSELGSFTSTLIFSVNERTHANYFIGHVPDPVTVHVIDQSSKECQSTGDPHYITFDNKLPYDWYGIGDYVMVKEISRVTHFTVHARLKYCRGNSGVTCNCGVAVREGNDVVIIDGCRSSFPELSFNPKRAYCDPAFQVFTSPGTFTIITPSKQEVELKIINIYYQIYIRINGAMYEKVEGLCGFPDGKANNDIALGPDGPVLDKCPSWPQRCYPELFAKHYKLKGRTSLFYKTPYIPDVPLPVCQCIKDQGEIVCSSHAEKSNPNENSATPCLRLLGPSKRSVDDVEYDDGDEYEPYDFPDEENDFNSSSIGWPTPSGITEDEARQRCTEALYASNIVDTCQDIGDVAYVTEGAIEDCIFDILVMDDLTVVEIVQMTMENECIATLNKNVSLWEVNEDGELAPPASIINAVCPRNCYGNGNCTMNGTCVCKEGFTDIDCSIVIGMPPELYGIRGSNYCDIRHRPCERFTVDGTSFLDSDDLSCHIQELEYDPSLDSWVKTGATIITKADLVSIYSVFCYLPEVSPVRRRAASMDDRGVSTHSIQISVSNDKVIESEPVSVLIYDSLCLNCSDAENCTQKVNTCLINGKCYAAFEESPLIDECMSCQPDKSTDSWNEVTSELCLLKSTTSAWEITGHDEPIPVRVPGQSPKWKTAVSISIGMAVVVGILVVVGGILLYKHKITKKKKVPTATLR